MAAPKPSNMQRLANAQKRARAIWIDNEGKLPLAVFPTMLMAEGYGTVERELVRVWKRRGNWPDFKNKVKVSRDLKLIRESTAMLADLNSAGVKGATPERLAYAVDLHATTIVMIQHKVQTALGTMPTKTQDDLRNLLELETIMVATAERLHKLRKDILETSANGLKDFGKALDGEIIPPPKKVEEPAPLADRMSIFRRSA